MQSSLSEVGATAAGSEKHDYSLGSLVDINQYMDELNSVESLDQAVQEANRRWNTLLALDSVNELAILNCASNKILTGDNVSAMGYLDKITDPTTLNRPQKYYSLKAKIHTARGNHQLAISAWKQACDFGYDTGQAYLRIASQYYQASDIDNALLFVEKAEQSTDDTEYATIIRARCQAHQKKWSLAIDLLKNYLNFKTHRESAAELLYRCYLNEFRSSSAEAVCRIFQDTDEGKFYRYRGKVKMQQYLYNDAIECFNRSFNLSQDVESKIWMIKALTSVHEHAAAEEQAHLSEMIDSSDLLSAGKLWEAAGVLSKAESRYRQAAYEAGGYEAHSIYINFLYRNRDWGTAYSALIAAEREGYCTESLDVIREKITSAMIATGRSITELRSDGPPADFHSSEEMVAAIVERILVRNQYQELVSNDNNVVLIIGSLGAGGAERQVVNLANGLAGEDGVDSVSLLCTHLSRTDQDLFYLDQVNERVHVEEYYLRSEVIDPRSMPELEGFADLLCHIQPTSRLQVILHMARALIDIKPTVVHGWLDETFINTALVCHMLGIKNVVGRWGSMPPGVHRTMTEKSTSNVRYLQCAYKEISRLPALKYSSNSKLTGDAYCNLLSIDSSDVEIIYNGVDQTELKRWRHKKIDHLYKEWGLPNDVYIVGTVIRISEEKRPFLFVDVAAEILSKKPSIHFVIVGGGPLENQLKDYIHSIGVEKNVHMVGKQSDVGQWYELFDVLLLTSRVEGVSNVVVESQMCGRTVVAPNVGGLSEAMADGHTGYLIDDDSAASFANTIIGLLIDKEKVSMFGENAVKFSNERFSLEKMVSSYRKLAKR